MQEVNDILTEISILEYKLKYAKAKIQILEEKGKDLLSERLDSFNGKTIKFNLLDELKDIGLNIGINIAHPKKKDDCSVIGVKDGKIVVLLRTTLNDPILLENSLTLNETKKLVELLDQAALNNNLE